MGITLFLVLTCICHAFHKMLSRIFFWLLLSSDKVNVFVSFGSKAVAKIDSCDRLLFIALSCFKHNSFVEVLPILLINIEKNNNILALFYIDFSRSWLDWYEKCININVSSSHFLTFMRIKHRS